MSTSDGFGRFPFGRLTVPRAAATTAIGAIVVGLSAACVTPLGSTPSPSSLAEAATRTSVLAAATQGPTDVPGEVASISATSFSTLEEGQYLLYSMSGTDASQEGYYPSTLYGVLGSGGAPKVLAIGPGRHARVSPDLHWVAFPRFNRRAWRSVLGLIAIGESTLHEVEGEVPESLSWSPDSDELVLSTDGNLEILAVPAMERSRFVDCSEYAGGPFHCFNPEWSPDGRWIAFYGTRGVSGPLLEENGLYLLGIECRTEPATCLDRALGPLGRYRQFAWSPDSTMIAAVDMLHDTSIALLSIPSGDVTDVIELRHFIDACAWSPDGRLLAVNSDGRILVVDIASGTVSMALDGPVDRSDVSWILISPR